MRRAFAVGRLRLRLAALLRTLPVFVDLPAVAFAVDLCGVEEVDLRVAEEVALCGTAEDGLCEAVVDFLWDVEDEV